MDAHKQAVATIASAVRQFFARREPYRIFHGSTNSTRPRTAATGHGGSDRGRKSPSQRDEI